MKVLGRRAFLLATGGAAVGLAAGTSPLALALSGNERLHTRRFLALGTRVTLVVRHPDPATARQALRDAVRAVYEIHETATLFEPSPLVRLNEAGASGPVPVPPLLGDLLGHGRRLTEETGGLFDPAVGRVTAAHRRAGTHRLSLDPVGYRAAGRHLFALDPTAGTARLLEAGATLDLNAFAKGYAVDRAARAMRERGVSHFLINAGGDLYAAGTPDPAEAGWLVRVADPARPARSVARLVVTDEAVATSGNYRQARLPDGSGRVHLVDPRIASAAEAVLSATVVAPTCADADAWATAIFIAGLTEAAPLLGGRPDLRAKLVDGAGAVHDV